MPFTASAVYFAVFVEDIYTTVRHDYHAVNELQHSITAVEFWCGYWMIKANDGSTNTTCSAGRLNMPEDKFQLN
jgi:hypothetical protein